MIASRQQACMILGIKYDASAEDIKAAYRRKVKIYHPDVNKHPEAKQRYMLVQEAYQYLINPRNESKNVASTMETYKPREAKIFGNDKSLRKQYERQKEAENEFKRAKQWEKAHRENYVSKDNTSTNGKENKTYEQQILEQIRAIWIAEGIRKSIEYEKKQHEIDVKRKLYKAFAQQQMNDRDNNEPM